MVTKAQPRTLTVHFHDDGQDFLEWDIKNGVVVDCRPFQASVWVGTMVHNATIKPGDILEVSFPTARGIMRHRTTLKHRVERVVDHLVLVSPKGKKQVMGTKILNKPQEHCPMCLADEKVFCARDVDAECLECGESFCGAHIGQHLKEVHCISLTLDHCREK